MPFLSVAWSAGTTISRRMRSTIFISRPRSYHFPDAYGARRPVSRRRSGGAGRRRRGQRLDQPVAAVLALVDHGDAPVGVMAEHQKRLVHQVQLHDRVGYRQRLGMELLGLDDLELRGRQGVVVLLRGGAVGLTVDGVERL